MRLTGRGHGGRAQTGKVKEENKMHAGSIADMQLSVDGTHFVTASFDNLAKLVDAQTLEVRRGARRMARCPGCRPQRPPGLRSPRLRVGASAAVPAGRCPHIQ